MALPIPLQQLKNLLVQEKLLTGEQFDAYALEAERKNQSLVDVLASSRIADVTYLNALIASVLGVEIARLGARVINEGVLKSLEENVARQRQVLVFDKEADGTFDVAMADPGDLETIEFLRKRFKGNIRPFLATLDDLNRGFSIYGLQSSHDFKNIIEENVQASLRSHGKEGEAAAGDLPIVAIVENILSYAVASRASDIHIEIMDEATIIRYRIDGILYEIMRIPKTVHAALVSRIKILAGLRIDEHYTPQDGRFRYRLPNQTIDVRVAVMPTFYGEKAEMRLLEGAQKPLSLEEIGMKPSSARKVYKNLKRSFGMVLVCGPTGSGKTTTLYSMVNTLNRPEVNIVTVEDPIEYNMRYINQSQINPQAGLTFANALRAFLRQDPNVIMVGEIRDKETAEIGVEAALTGHLLLSSLHTNDAPSAISRMRDFGIPPFLVGSTLTMVVAQRLVRRICPSCIHSYEPSPDQEKAITDQLHSTGIPEREHITPKRLFRGEGCDACGATGYRGRLAIFEILIVTEEIKRLIAESELRLDALIQDARKEGMRSMFEDGLEKIQVGLTSLEEVFRVIRE